MNKKLFLILIVAVLTVASLSSYSNKQNPAANITKSENTTEITTSVEIAKTTSEQTIKVVASSTKSTTEKKTTTISPSKTKTTAFSTTKVKTTLKPTTKPTTTARPTTTTKPKITTQKATTNSTVTTNSAAVSVVTENDLAKICDGFIKLVNQERAKCGVVQLKVNSSLTSSAKNRSKEITQSFSHTRPNGKTFHSAINKNVYPYSYIAENIQKTTHIGSRSFTDKDLFVGRDDQIVEAYTRIFNNFKNSSEHYSHLTNSKFKDTGIGISYTINPKTGMSMFFVVHILGTL